MSDETKPTEVVDTTTEGSSDEGRKASDEDTVSRAELNRVISERDKFKRELKDFKSSVNKEQETQFVKSGDIEALRKSFDTERNEYQEKLSSLQKSLEVNLLEKEVLRVAAEVTTDADVAFMLLKDRFELHDEDGKLTPRVIDDSRPIKEFIERELEKRGKTYLLKSTRKPGTDARQTTDGKPLSRSVEEVLRLPAAEQRKAFAADPALAKKALEVAMPRR